ncbi:hypothetical protein P153DRAFT_282786 [Dothidotthia symphoricarpi CBS 119687]|uniref:C2H2-type domain-containing protein n=1 Tax=Dothidotthia symphoricarpi CBS 119687 TaxID=1392245 RepID=A0A6A6ANX2_9PLEO|nr:uncharacterized protein P153DRAFT_282786 [Dothidotthia symphoricarpi CBS 119687]KAF2133490.1 hypothetical protein P153DRAFT_282786 [Dothidotthia symphoricarpi CBS 119687]
MDLYQPSWIYRLHQALTPVERWVPAFRSRNEKQLLVTQRNTVVPTPDNSVDKRSRDEVRLDHTEDHKAKRRRAGHESLRLKHFPISKCTTSEGVTCPCCQERYEDGEKVFQHLVSASRLKQACVLCPSSRNTTKVVDNMKTFPLHMQKHTDDRLECSYDGCDYEANSQQRLRVHTDNVHTSTPQIQEPKQCELCPQVLGSIDAYNVHMKAHENKLVACNHCNEMVPYANLKAHKATECLKLPARVAACVECGYEMATTHVARHMRTAHSRVEEVMDFGLEHYPELAGKYKHVLDVLEL